MTKDGKPYGPARYKELVQELYYISKSIHTSYEELKTTTPTERKYILEFIADEIKREKQARDTMLANNKKQSKR